MWRFPSVSPCLAHNHLKHDIFVAAGLLHMLCILEILFDLVYQTLSPFILPYTTRIDILTERAVFLRR